MMSPNTLLLSRSSTQSKGAERRISVGLGLGSNIGDKAGNIDRALALLGERGIFTLTRRSSNYRTPPWGDPDQDDFVNACATGTTVLEPLALLAAAKQVENDMGRVATRRWGPRLIDIDILFYGDETRASDKLTLPHREMFRRAFVLVPLAEIAPGLVIGDRAIAAIAAQIDRTGIEKCVS
jgi:2-amino-4-hydroxy-6-hydroxymethyldihydropteridine diphosphokinase